MTAATTTENSVQDTYFAPRDAVLASFKFPHDYKELWTQGRDSQITRLVIRFVDQVVKANEDIERLGADLVHRVERVNKQIAAGQHINGLGELQRLPVEYDQACAARQTAIEDLRAVIAAWKATQEGEK